MTVSTTAASDSFIGNGTTKTFPCDFKVFDDDHLEVYVDGVLQTLTTHYTVSGVGNDITDVVFVAAPADQADVSVFRKVPLTQETDYLVNDEFPAETHERALDLATMGLQQLDTAIKRALRAADADPAGIVMVLPAAAARAGKLLSFDDEGQPIAAEGTEFGVLTTGDANTWTALQTYKGNQPLELVQEDAGGTAIGPILRLFRDASAPATNDELAGIYFEGNDDADNRQRYAQINATIHNFATQDGQLDFVTRINDVLVNGFRLDNRGGIPAGGAFWAADDGATEGPYTVATRRSATPAANDFIGAFVCIGHNSDLNQVNYFKIRGKIQDPTAGAEIGQCDMSILDGGVNKILLGFRPFGLELAPGAGACRLIVGTGSPEGVHNGPPGSLFLRTDGGASTTLYVKESGTGNTGWAAK